MWQLKSGVLLIAATLICASCGGASAVPTAPGAVSDQAVGAGIAAQVVQPSGSNAPMISSDVHGHALISTSATNTNCQGQPGDPLGLDRPSVTLPAPVPIVQFGSRLTEVRSASHNLRGTTFVGSVRTPRLPANCFR
jgi:hypothetical protein